MGPFETIGNSIPFSDNSQFPVNNLYSNNFANQFSVNAHSVNSQTSNSVNAHVDMVLDNHSDNEFALGNHSGNGNGRAEGDPANPPPHPVLRALMCAGMGPRGGEGG